MKKLIVYIAMSCLTIMTSSFRWSPAGSERTLAASHLFTDSVESIYSKASFLYEEIGLAEKGLSETAFEYAYKGYEYLLKKNLISEGAYLTICDFTQSSKQKRFYLIDIVNNKIVLNTYVAHGRNSGGEYATKFSNKASSRESSLGFYITKNIYLGEHGLSLRVDGLEPGFNDRAYRRAIVIHGADYIGEGSTGRSYGCPAVPLKESKTIINTIKDGSCLFIYHPQKKYLQSSKILNS